MEKRTLLAFVLSILVIVGFGYLQSKNQPKVQPQPAPGAVSEQKPEAVTVPASVPAPVSPVAEKERQAEEPVLPGREIVVETDLYRAVFNTRGGRLVSLGLKHYTRKNEPYLETINSGTGILPFEIEGQNKLLFTADRSAITLSSAEPQAVLTLQAAEAGRTVVKKFTFDNRKYGMDVSLTVKKPETPEGGKLQLAAFSVAVPVVRGQGGEEEIISSAAGKVNRLRVGSFKGETRQLPESVYLGKKEQYTVTFLKPSRPLPAVLNADASGNVSAFFALPTTADQVSGFYFYAGPGDHKILAAEGIGIAELMPSGPMVVLGRFILDILSFFHGLIPNWGVAIILLTILFKIVFFPLTRISLRTMKVMQKLQPYMKDLSKKYKDNPQAMQKELFGIYRQYRINPAAGCLPMLAQMPIFIAIFIMLRNAVVLRGANFGLWINDLSMPDRLFVFSSGGRDFPVNLLPVLMGATMFFQQKLSSAGSTGMAAEQQKMMLFLMPVMLTVFLYNLPSGLMLYWVTTNLISILEQEIATHQLK